VRHFTTSNFYDMNPPALDPRASMIVRSARPMPSIYDLKPAFQGLLRPLMRSLRTMGATPNTITSLALLGSIAVGIGVGLAGRQPMILLLLPVWLFVRMALNALDGMMAREMNMATRLGGALNE